MTVTITPDALPRVAARAVHFARSARYNYLAQQAGVPVGRYIMMASFHEYGDYHMVVRMEILTPYRDVERYFMRTRYDARLLFKAYASRPRAYRLGDRTIIVPVEPRKAMLHDIDARIDRWWARRLEQAAWIHNANDVVVPLVYRPNMTAM